MSDDLPEEVQKLRALLSDEFGVPEDSAADLLERQIGLDITEIKPDDADKFVDAWEAGDFDTIGSLMREYDVPDQVVDRFLSMASESKSSQSESSASASGGDALEARVNKIENELQNIPSQEDIADSVVHKLQSSMGGGGGGGQAAPDGGATGGQNDLAPIISAIMSSQGGSGAGQMMEEAAMKSFVRKMTRPSLGEMMEMSMMKEMSEKMAPVFAEQMGDDWAEKYFSVPEQEFINDEDEDD